MSTTRKYIYMKAKTSRYFNIESVCEIIDAIKLIKERKVHK